MTRANRTAKPKGSPRQKESKYSLGQPYQFIVGLVDVLEEEVTENDQIDKPLNEKKKTARVLENILATGLNDQVLTKREEHSVILIASANHDLNMCRRDLFKAYVDIEHKTTCSSKEPVGSELFGNDFTECLKSVKESKKHSQPLTNQMASSSKG